MKKVLIPVLTLSLILGGLYAGAKVGAFGFGNGDMLESIAQKLGKSTEEVETAMDEIRQDHQVQMQADYATRLNEAVQNGDLTDTQKQLILDKHEEMQARHQAEFEQRQQEHQELESWAKENNIDPQYLYGFGGMGKSMGMHGGRGGMMRGGF